MAEFKQIIEDALDILKFDGAVQDTLAELRRKWGAQVPALLDERFDAVGVQYMKLSHEKGAAALGQELSAFGWALYNLDDEDEYSMHLHHFESEEDQGKPYDIEQANLFGLSIAYDPYKRELVDGKTLTTCGGDGGCNVCGGMGPLLGYLPCSPHCKPEVREDNEIHNDYDFFRPVIRVQTSGWRMVSSEDER